MSYLSSGAQLLGNLEHTAAELLETTMQERGRGFASDNESWAEIKTHLERAKKATGDLEKVHKEMWDAIKDQNEDAYGALANELPRRALPAVRAGPADESQKRHAGMGHAGRERMKKAADRWHRSTATKKNTHERRFSSPPL